MAKNFIHPRGGCRRRGCRRGWRRLRDAGHSDRKNNAAITDFAIILAPFWVMIRLLKKVSGNKSA